MNNSALLLNNSALLLISVLFVIVSLLFAGQTIEISRLRRRLTRLERKPKDEQTSITPLGNNGSSGALVAADIDTTRSTAVDQYALIDRERSPVLSQGCWEPDPVPAVAWLPTDELNMLDSGYFRPSSTVLAGWPKNCAVPPRLSSALS